MYLKSFTIIFILFFSLRCSQYLAPLLASRQSDNLCWVPCRIPPFFYSASLTPEIKEKYCSTNNWRLAVLTGYQI